MPSGSGGPSVAFAPLLRTNLCTNPNMETASGTVVTRTNLCTNPNMETAGPLVTTRTNLCTNPNVVTDTAGYTVGGGAITRVAQGSGWAASVDGSTAVAFISPTTPGVIGEFWSARATINGPAGRTLTGSGDTGPSYYGSAVSVTLTGSPQEISIVSDRALSVNGTPRVYITPNSIGGAWTSGQMLTMTNVVLEKVSGIGVPAGPYFDGATPAVLRRNLVPNPNFETNLGFWTVQSGTVTRDTVSPISGTASLKFDGVSSVQLTSVTVPSVAVGDVVTLSFDYRTVGTLSVAPRIEVFQVAPWVGQTLVLPVTQTTTGRFSVSTTMGAITGLTAYVYANGSGIMYVDNFLIEKSSTANPYFDGSTVEAGYTYGWEGAANASTSKQIGADFTYSWAGVANASASLEQAPGLVGWYDQSGSQTIRNSRSPISGLASARTSGGGQVYTLVGANAGDTFTYSVDVAFPNGVQGPMGSHIQLLASADGYSGPYGDMSGQPPGRKSLTYTVVNGGGTVAFYIASGNMVTDVVHFDNVLIEKTSVALPYFDGTTRPDLRTNLCPNPRVAVGLTNWDVWSNFNIARVASGSGYAAEFTQATSLGQANGGIAVGLSPTPGRYISAKVALKAGATLPAGSAVRLAIFDGISWIAGNIGYVIPTTGTLDVDILSTAAVNSGAWELELYVYADAWPSLGNSVLITNVIATEVSGIGVAVSGSFFDGSPVPGYTNTWLGTANASPSTQVLADDTYAWTGTVNASTSTVSSPGMAGWSAANGATFTKSRVSPISGSASGKLVPAGNQYALVKMPINALAIDFITFSFDYRTQGTLVVGYYFNLYHADGISRPATNVTVNLPNTQLASARFSVTVPASVDGLLNAQIVARGSNAGETIYIDNVLIEKISAVRPYFDGSTVDPAGALKNSWSGAVNASTSLQYDVAIDYPTEALLFALGGFPQIRLARCGATAAQLASMATDWATHNMFWQADMGMYLETLTDAAVTLLLSVAWPPAIPAAVLNGTPFT